MPEPLLTIGIVTAAAVASAPLRQRYSAVSPEALTVRQHAEEVQRQTELSVALFHSKAMALSELTQLVAECSEENWDGYGGAAVEGSAVKLAREVIRSLPEDIPMPEFSVEPDGCIALDWQPSHIRNFTLSAGKSHRLPYAWMDGTERGYAVAGFLNGQLSPRVLDEIRRIYGNDTTFGIA